MADVAMPRLSDSMEEGTILKWLKSDGDEVKRGEELVEIETDKANMTYEADSDGVLRIVAKEGDTLPVGETIARLGDGSESGGGEDGRRPRSQRRGGADEEPEESRGGRGRRGGARRSPPPRRPRRRSLRQRQAVRDPRARARRGAGVVGQRRRRRHGRVKASPVAKRMAREMGVELAELKGSGPGGRIVKADVEAAAKGGGTATAKAEAPPQEEQEPRRPPPRRSRRRTCRPPSPRLRRTARAAAATSPSRTSRACSRRSRGGWRSRRPPRPTSCSTSRSTWRRPSSCASSSRPPPVTSPRPSFNDFVIKASALALRDFPRANGAYRDGKFELYSRVNVGVAVAGQDALVVPTMFDADSKWLGRIARQTSAVVQRVRTSAVTPPELSSGTFTVSNLGMFGIKRFVAIINPPQAAILAVGALEPRPVVHDGEVDRTLDHGAHAVLRPPDPLRRRRRRVPREIRAVPRASLRLALCDQPAAAGGSRKRWMIGSGRSRAIETLEPGG